MPFDAAAARETIMGPERAKLDAYALMLDELDATIVRALDTIADRGYADGGTVAYPNIDFATMRDVTRDAPRVRRVAWVVGAIHTPAGYDSSARDDLYLLDETASLTISQYGDRTRATGFENLYVVPAYQSTTRHVNDWSVTSVQTNPLILTAVLQRFITDPGRFPILTSPEVADYYAQYKAVVGEVVR